MRKRTLGLMILIGAIGIIANAREASAVTCCVAGVTPCYAGNITEANCPSGSLCGCTVSGSNCTLTLSANVNTSSANTCLTLGSGVTFDMNGKTINCTGSDCGKAVQNTSSGGASNKVIVKNGTITGCFDAGLYFDWTGGSNTNSSVADMKIDLGSSCTNGILYGNGDYFNVGISGPYGTISRTHIKRTDIAVEANSSTDIEDSSITDNTNGVNGPVASIDNVLLANNSYHLWEFKGVMNPDISGSSFVNAGVCSCATTPTGASNAESCQADLTYCGTFQAPSSHDCIGSPATCVLDQ